MKNMLRLFIYAMIGMSVVIIDQLVKYYVLMVCDQRCEINQFLSFDIAFNRGVSWGMFHSKSDIVISTIVK
jgi:Signal peptidase (SPase) II.